jgi:hypothetical protein
MNPLLKAVLHGRAFCLLTTTAALAGAPSINLYLEQV